MGTFRPKSISGFEKCVHPQIAAGDDAERHADRGRQTETRQARAPSEVMALRDSSRSNHRLRNEAKRVAEGWAAYRHRRSGHPLPRASAATRRTARTRCSRAENQALGISGHVANGPHPPHPWVEGCGSQRTLSGGTPGSFIRVVWLAPARRAKPKSFRILERDHLDLDAPVLRVIVRIVRIERRAPSPTHQQ